MAWLSCECVREANIIFGAPGNSAIAHKNKVQMHPLKGLTELIEWLLNGQVQAFPAARKRDGQKMWDDA